MDTPARPFPVATRFRDGTPVRDRYPTDAEAALDVVADDLKALRGWMEDVLLQNQAVNWATLQRWQSNLESALYRLDVAREKLADSHSRHVDRGEPALRLAAGPDPSEPRRSRA